MTPKPREWKILKCDNNGDRFIHGEDTDEDGSYDAFCDATMKHQIFDYWPSNRPKGLGNFPANTNDLPWVLADYATMDPLHKEAIEHQLKG
jgi:hypothetical protein